MPKGKCPVCKQSVKIEEGMVIPHNIRKRIGKSMSVTPCSGGGEPPK